MKKSILEELQAAVTARVESLAMMEYVPVTQIRPREAKEALQIQTDIDKALAGLAVKNGKNGAAALVMMPVIDVNTPNAPGPVMVPSLTVRVIENPMVNMGESGTQLSAETLAVEILESLHLFDPALGTGPFFAGDNAMVPVDEYAGKVVYDVTVKMPGIAKRTTPKSITPILEADGRTVTLRTIQEGAEIYYTLDGSFPWIGNSFAVGVSGGTTTLEFNDAVTIRAAAYAQKMNGSDVTSLTIK